MIKIVYLMMIIRDAYLIIVILTYIIMKNRSPLKISPTNHEYINSIKRMPLDKTKKVPLVIPSVYETQS